MTDYTLRNAALYQAQCSDCRHHSLVRVELIRACGLFPHWPNDMLHAVAIINEEIGELNKAILQFHYEPGKGKTVEDIREEAIQSLAMLHRFLNSLDMGMYIQGYTGQHILGGS